MRAIKIGQRTHLKAKSDSFVRSIKLTKIKSKFDANFVLTFGMRRQIRFTGFINFQIRTRVLIYYCRVQESSDQLSYSGCLRNKLTVIYQTSKSFILRIFLTKRQLVFRKAHLPLLATRRAVILQNVSLEKALLIEIRDTVINWII